MDDIRRAAPKSKVLNRDRARFDIAGGNYRLIVAVTVFGAERRMFAGVGVKIDKPPEGLGDRTRPGARARSGRIVFTRLDARKPFGIAGGDAICGSSTSPKDCLTG